MLQMNYCQIIPPLDIYPDDLRKIMVLLETVLFPTNTVDQHLMCGITEFMRNKLIEYENRQHEKFSDMRVATWTSSDGEACSPANEANTEVNVAPNFPYASEEEKQEIKAKSVKKAKKRKAK
jgi:hypothetical protein